MTESDPSSAESEREDRLLAIVQGYTAAVEAGQKPDRRALMRQNPDLADDLSACLGGLTFLNAAAGQLAATAHDLVDPTAAGPQLLGDYRLLREIGRGGMGVVYEAEQLSLGRRVAVKVLPMAAALDARQLQRFRNEAQAAAQLHHTHIVPVYAVGCERSVHYYAMQLIDGQSLADVIADLKAEAIPEESKSGASLISHPSANLTSLRTAKRAGFYRTVARLGLQAAEALHHAHHAGIVHRDIKPANLLLDHEAGLWITDFGLAQFYAEDNNLTQSSDRPGTLRYMSPEQASGRAVVLDQRTDVYSLGVTLFELLTLEKAVPGETREQMQYQLQNEDLRPARSIDAAIPKEFDTILATACAKDPEDRYATAGALAEDLRRFLDDEPILAKRPPLSQRAVKWVRRHRTVAWSAAITVLLLLAGFVVSTVQIARAQARTQAAYFNEKDRAAEAVRERLRAQRAFSEARDAVNFFARVAATELNDDRPNPDLRREMLEAAVDYYEAFMAQRRDDPAASKELAEAKDYVEDLLAELAVVEDAFRVRSLARIVQDDAVAADLRLIPTQRASITERLAALTNTNDPPDDIPFGGRGPGSQFRRLRLIASASRTRAELAALLLPTQADRLRQIARQAAGPGAFADPEVIKALNLSLQQKDAVRTILSEGRAAGRRPTTMPEISDAFDRFDPPYDARAGQRATSLNALLALLDPQQTAAWYAIIGRPFPSAARFDPEPRRIDNGRFDLGRFDPNRFEEGPPRDGPPPPPPSNAFGPR